MNPYHDLPKPAAEQKAPETGIAFPALAGIAAVTAGSKAREAGAEAEANAKAEQRQRAFAGHLRGIDDKE